MTWKVVKISFVNLRPAGCALYVLILEDVVRATISCYGMGWTYNISWQNSWDKFFEIFFFGYGWVIFPGEDLSGVGEDVGIL